MFVKNAKLWEKCPQSSHHAQRLLFARFAISSSSLLPLQNSFFLLFVRLLSLSSASETRKVSGRERERGTRLRFYRRRRIRRRGEDDLLLLLFLFIGERRDKAQRGKRASSWGRKQSYSVKVARSSLKKPARRRRAAAAVFSCVKRVRGAIRRR